MQSQHFLNTSSVAFPVAITTKALRLQRRTLKLREEEQLTQSHTACWQETIQDGVPGLLASVWCCEACPLTLALPEVVC